MKYDLQRLGGIGFQDVVAALAIKVLGAHVRPMGRGKDGGRDMLVNKGTLLWAPNGHYSERETWDGTTVFQVKHKETLEGPQKDATTLWQHIKEELDTWASSDSKRGAVPHYFVFASNIPLTPAQGGGGFDTINSRIQKFLDDLKDETAEDHLQEGQRARAREERLLRRDRMRSLRAWRLWDGNQLEGLLDAHEGVRRAFDGFLTLGDVLADQSALSTNLTSNEMGPALKEHARWALLNERRVYFSEAGGEAKGVPVEQVVVDLPVLAGSGVPERLIRYVLDRGDHVLKPVLSSLERPRHLVVTGAPGNGKSTVAKFLTHVYRAAFLGEDTDLGDEHQTTVDNTKTALGRMGRATPSNRRWPINVDLAKFASQQATDSEYTLQNWIVFQLNRQVTTKDVPRWGLDDWLRKWPSFVVLDGLDEVSEPSVRQTLIANIESFVGEAESKDWDLLVVVTTRPTGYADDMQPTMFERINLADLSTKEALDYGRLVTRIRVPDDEDRREGIITLLEEAAENEALKHLLRTPLQTLIMSIIAESAGRFSPSRFDLFWGYYKVIEQREKNKKLGASKLLRDYAPQILELHLRVGLRLQKIAETAAGSDAVLPSIELRDIAWNVLKDAGYEPSNKDKPLLDEIVNAATHRLVLLTPQASGGYGYEVRSLQELMAAYALTTGKLEQCIPELRKIGASPHWRNTLLFSAGRYFSEPQPYQKEAITSLVLSLDEGVPERLGSIFPVGPILAIEMVDDGMTSEPVYLHRLVHHALDALQQPGLLDSNVYTEMVSLESYASMLMSAAENSEVVRGIIADRLRAALNGGEFSRGSAVEVQESILRVGKRVETSSHVLSLAAIKRDYYRSVTPESRPDWEEYWNTIRGYSEPGTADVLNDVASLLERAAKEGVPNDWVPLELQRRLSDRDIAFVVEAALSHVAEASWFLVGLLRHDVLPTLWRKPVDLDGSWA